MEYKIYNIRDNRIVCIHKKYERYYVQDLDFFDKNLKIFKTRNLNNAKHILEITKMRWNGIGVESWCVVNERGEVIK